MSNYARQAKRKNLENKAPRCCGRHMVMNRYGLWQCKKCGRLKFNTTASVTLNSAEDEVVQNGTAQIVEPEQIGEGPIDGPVIDAEEIQE